MGFINFAGYYIFLKALATGPLSIVVAITGMYFIVPIILSIIIYKEKLTFGRMAAIFLTGASVILLRH